MPLYSVASSLVEMLLLFWINAAASSFGWIGLLFCCLALE
jgi:hypothetical protein